MIAEALRICQLCFLDVVDPETGANYCEGCEVKLVTHRLQALAEMPSEQLLYQSAREALETPPRWGLLDYAVALTIVLTLVAILEVFGQ